MTGNATDQVAVAIGFLNQVIKIHQGHIDGTVKPDMASMEKEMELLKKALAALNETSKSYATEAIRIHAKKYWGIED